MSAPHIAGNKPFDRYGWNLDCAAAIFMESLAAESDRHFIANDPANVWYQQP